MCVGRDGCNVLTILNTTRFSTKLSRLVLSLDCLSFSSAFPSPLCRGGENTLRTREREGGREGGRVGGKEEGREGG